MVNLDTMGSDGDRAGAATAWESERRETLASPASAAVADLFFRYFAGQPRTARILEVGCGEGQRLARLRDLGFRSLWGLEATERDARSALARGLRVRRGTVHALTPETFGQRFDFVVLQGVLDGIDRMDAAVERAASALEAEGRVYAVVHVHDSLSKRAERLLSSRSKAEQAAGEARVRVPALSRGRVDAAFRRAGLAPEVYRHVYNPFPLPFAAARLNARLHRVTFGGRFGDILVAIARLATSTPVRLRPTPVAELEGERKKTTAPGPVFSLEPPPTASNGHAP